MQIDKKTVLTQRILWLLVLIMVLGVTSSATADKITIVADEWSPYNGNPISAKPGYGIEIAQQIFAAVGHNVVYEVVPWVRAIEETRMGKYNAIIGAIKDEAADFIFPEEEFGSANNAFFAKIKSNWQYTGLESLRTQKIGVIKGYYYGSELDLYLKQNQDRVQYSHGVDPLSKIIKKLLVGRVDVLIEDENVLLHKVRKMGVAGRVVIVGSHSDSNVYIAFSPELEKSKEYAEVFTAGIRKLRDSGELDEILARYGLNSWK